MSSERELMQVGGFTDLRKVLSPGPPGPCGLDELCDETVESPQAKRHTRVKAYHSQRNPSRRIVEE